MDPAFARFLSDRLTEEALDARRRIEAGDASPADEQAARRAEGGARMLHELLWDLEQGNPPDQMSLDLLVLAYGRHPDFRPEWNRWRAADGLPRDADA